MNSKKVIIVGATSGMGRELARIYASAGAQVGVTGRRQDLLYTLQTEFPNKIVTECFDVTGHNNIAHLQSLINKLGGLDIFIDCAGIGVVSSELSRDADKLTIDTNINGFAEMVNWVYNYFLLNNVAGQIVNLSSVAAWRGNSWAPAYSASKAFQSVYFEGLAMKAKRNKSNIVITDIQPGFVYTKESQGNKRFWVSSVQKAARQIYKSIEAKKTRAYVSRRWRMVAFVLKWAPNFLYHKVG
ncbi:MAG: oxidoreductase [Bacteroidetes bacterium]|nr:MAG: oxidoreductase [Bacteroidota bacterium]